MADCPSCGDDANIQKASAIYREQTVGSVASELARLLAPPRLDSPLRSTEPPLSVKPASPYSYCPCLASRA